MPFYQFGDQRREERKRILKAIDDQTVDIREYVGENIDVIAIDNVRKRWQKQGTGTMSGRWNLIVMEDGNMNLNRRQTQRKSLNLLLLRFPKRSWRQSQDGQRLTMRNDRRRNGKLYGPAN